MGSSGDGFVLSFVSWADKRDELMSVRHPVFVDEQKVPADIEIDDREDACVHVLVTDKAGRPVGTGRLDVDGKIGRMAVLGDCRNLGVGEMMMDALMDRGASDGIEEFYVHAQIRARDFYLKCGFDAIGAEFEEAGIVHVEMRRNLRAK